MSPAFVTITIALALFAAALVVIPLLARRQGSEPSSPWTALVAAALIVGSSVLLYPLWSNWTWPPESEALTPEAMVGRLARRLERTPDNLEGWLQLGRSYSVMEQFPLAIRAYQRADQLAHGKNVDALVGMAELLTLQDVTSLEGKAGTLFERALAIDPKSEKALFFSALSAQRRGDRDQARDRYARLLVLDPPDNVKSLLERQIRLLEQQK